MRLKFTKDSRGIGLMETVIVTGIFAISMGIISVIMINSIKHQRIVHAEQVVVGAARDTIETLAREIRLGYIDYMAHIDASDRISDDEPDSNPTTNLHIKSYAGSDIEITTNAEGEVMAGNLKISSDEINVTDLTFYVQPTSDPFWVKRCDSPNDCDYTNMPVMKDPTGLPGGFCTPVGICLIEDEQPRVTIVMRAETNEPADSDRFTVIDLQTTVSTRTYQR
ncbi:hypothetical protein KKG41_05485 [Patescibacteria group bacterium]|nr:hypothetical protein [Patescibacteria group bacterium]MBU1890315.1 hypothetical protein [Patescibacteria group bacterium]